MRGSRGGRQRVWTPPPENHKSVGFSSNTGPDTLKSQSCQASIQCGPLSARQRNAIPMAYRCKADIWPLLVIIRASLPIKTLIRVGPPLTKLSGSAYKIERAF